MCLHDLVIAFRYESDALISDRRKIGFFQSRQHSIVVYWPTTKLLLSHEANHPSFIISGHWKWIMQNVLRIFRRFSLYPRYAYHTIRIFRPTYKGEETWRMRKKGIVQFFLSCTASIPHARSRVIARRTLSGISPRSSTHICRHREEKHFPEQSHAHPHVSIIIAPRSTRKRSRFVPGRCSPRSKNGGGKRGDDSLSARQAQPTTRAARRTARTARQQPDRIVPRLRRQCPRVGGLSAADAVGNPDCGPPHHRDPPTDRSPPQSLSVTYTTPVSPAWYVDVRPTDDASASGVREQLSLLRVNRGDDDFSSRRGIIGESIAERLNFTSSFF